MSLRSGEQITIPSPIDVHVHLRQPGGEEKETIESGTYAALRGGYQAVFDMPNNPGVPTWTRARLQEKIAIAEKESHTKIGFYAGVDLNNPDFKELLKMLPISAGLKLYMGKTTGNEFEHNLETAQPVIEAWTSYVETHRMLRRPPILLHAAGGVGAETVDYIASHNYPVHWCHLSTEIEARLAAFFAAKYPDCFTAGVTPHHLTMTSKDADFKYGWPGGRMMPPLGDEVDSESLLYAFNSGAIAILETDHAPHTLEDKLQAETDNPCGANDEGCTTCFGVSGIEFALPIMMSLVQRQLISLERLSDSLYDKPLKMLGLAALRSFADAATETTLEIQPYVIEESDFQGRSRNNPYLGWTAWGRVREVSSRNQKILEDGVLLNQGQGLAPLILNPSSKV